VAVTLIVRGDRILSKEDDEAARLLQQELLRHRIDLRAGCTVTKVSREDDRRILLDLQSGAGERQAVWAEMLFIAAGIAPNINGLALEKAGVRCTPAGIEVDESLRTTAENIFACGDAVRRLPFANVAEYQAGIAVRNALSGGREEADYEAVPWCVFTEPALAHFGPTEQEARERYDDMEVYKIDYRENDQAIVCLEDTGFAKVLCTSDGKIIGAHIVGASAGEIIHPLITAKAAGMTLAEMEKLVFVYPSLSEMIKRLGEQYVMRKNIRLQHVLA
jgi:pyruvate/2-oxoglutarate dehydrogenase complex dihydrolipoamide dehydrogenase (E3) component